MGWWDRDVSGPATVCHAGARTVQFIADFIEPRRDAVNHLTERKTSSEVFALN